MDTRMLLWVGIVVVGFVMLLGLLRRADLRGCVYWLGFGFWGGLSMWVLMVFLSGRVHL